VKKVRASLGTLAVLGMELMIMDAPPTTAYLQIYTDEHCRANCLFCSQAKESKGELKHIARGQYMPADLDEVVRRLGIAFEKGYLHRACIQTAMYPGMWDDTKYLVREITKTCSIPISLSVFPLDDIQYSELQRMGLEQLVIPLDAVTPELFEKIKGAGAGGPFTWDKHIDGLERAARIFRNVGTHIIIGLSETDKDVIELVGKFQQSGIGSALFAYTRLPGTRWVDTKPDIGHYRRVQLASYLIREELVKFENMKFDNGMIMDFGLDGPGLEAVISSGEAFMTTGCSHCNRPYATETHAMVYNYPGPVEGSEITRIKVQLELNNGI